MSDEQLYAIADFVPKDTRRAITPGKPYRITGQLAVGTHIELKDNNGCKAFYRVSYCPSLGGESWRIVKESDLTAEERDRAGLPSIGNILTGSQKARWDEAQEQRTAEDAIEGLRSLAEITRRNERRLDRLGARVEALQRSLDQRFLLMGERTRNLEAKLYEYTTTAQEAKQPPLTWPGSKAAVEPDSDGWIEHDGGKCPVDPNTMVDLRFEGGDELKGLPASNPYWPDSKGMPAPNITHYRPAKQEPPTARFEEKARRQGKSWAYNMYMQAQQQEAEWPQAGDKYWYIMSSGTGEVAFGWWEDFDIDRGRRDFLGIYPTREAAEEAAGKIRRIMDHLRAGEMVVLERGGVPLQEGEAIKL